MKLRLTSFAIVALLLVESFTAFSQTELLQVKYSITYKRFTESKSTLTRSAFLIINPNVGSRYALFNLIMHDSLTMAKKANPAITKVNTGNAMYDEFNELIEKSNASSTLSVTCKGIGPFTFDYFTYKQNPAINWTLADGVDSVLNRVCSKATTTYMGREYVAWYDPALPISDGPWKFSGLPGLILRIYDTERIFDFKATDIRPVTRDRTANLFKGIERIIPISHEKYWKQKKTNRENPVQALVDKTGVGTWSDGYKVNDPNSPHKPSIFNALEKEFVK